MIYNGILSAEGRRFAIIASRFNEFISSKLLSGAIDCLVRHKCNEKDIDTFWVPGSFEIPIIAKKLAENKKYHAVICLGAILKGDTMHNHYVSSEVAKGIAQVGLSTGVPVAFGIINADTLEQAIERAGTKAGNRGFEAALSAIEMADLVNQIK
ncbi:MAG: 6,7-dimethyl-8-ribityllumazine synthase [Candidatus Helarchaeota archaeon]|nr:6,7-dimethyl-8-ribityllumazine synthase [Candidatus Helarchaeota archaeon]